MGLLGFRLPFSSVAPESREFLAYYLRLRPVRRALNDAIVATLSDRAIPSGAKKLGMLQGNTLVLDSEAEMSILMDYCIYDVRHQGRSAVERYLCDHPPEDGSLEMTCLQAMQQATYALVLVKEIEPGVGCRILNLYTDETRLLVDVGLSKTACRDLLLATRLIDFGDFVTTSGASLPMGRLPDEEVDCWLGRFREAPLGDDKDPAALIRAILECDGGSSVRFAEPGELGAPPPWYQDRAERPRIVNKKQSKQTGPNRRCRCGSGKMHKNCCGKQRPV